MATAGTSSTPAVFHPPLLWGLDCHFNSFNRLYITDILNMKPHPEHPGAVAYGNHPMYKVDVMGVVVRKAEKHKLFQYALDDGTGVVNCCVWKLRYTSHEPEVRTGGLAGLGVDLRSLLTSLRSERDTEVITYDLGDLLHVRGQVKVFRSNVEIVASYHRRVDNPNQQVMRMLELPALYQQCYDKPFEAPSLIEQEVSGQEQGGQFKPDLPGLNHRQAPFSQNHRRQKQGLRVRIQEVLSTLNSAEFSLHDLLMDPSVSALASGMDKEGAVRETLREMEEVEGTVCIRNQTSLPYENLDRLCPLEGQVLSALRTLCCRPKNRDKGCHIQQVLSEVQRSVQYSCLHCAALQHVLNRLETNSDVIRMSAYCYLPL